MDLNHRFDAIKQKFMSRLAEWEPSLGAFINLQSQKSPSVGEVADVHMRLHKIAGSAKTFGFPELSVAAADAEKHLEAIASGKAPLPFSKQALKSLLEFHRQLQGLLTDSPAEVAIPHPQEAQFKPDRRHTILVADDDDLVRELLVSEFIRSSCHIMQASDGNMVLDIIKSCAMHSDAEKPDLILLDVNMPGVNGFDLLKKLKSTPATQGIPVVMLTRRDEDESIINAISFGAVDYITKPFDMADLIHRITDQLATRSRKILIADDDDLIRELLSHRFHRIGTSVVTAKSGPEALQRIRAERPDAVVLDVMMPGMSGINVLKYMKQDAELKHIPVLLLTAKSQQENILLGLESGAHDYVTKPFDTNELVARVNGILQRSQNT